MESGKIAALILLLLPAAAGCSAPAQSLPPRTAQEQMLISTAADRSLARIDFTALAGRRVYVDDSQLQAFDKPYVLGKLRNFVSFCGGLLVNRIYDADVVIEPRSGALSINESTFLLGLPQIPIPLLGQGFSTPEIAVFKYVRQTGIAKFSCFGYDAITRKLVFSSGTNYGSARISSFTILLVGPFAFDNLPPIPKEADRTDYPLTAAPPPARQPGQPLPGEAPQAPPAPAGGEEQAAPGDASLQAADDGRATAGNPSKGD